MPNQLTDEQRKIRNRERTARLFARYKHTGTDERGSPDAWKLSAHAMLQGSTPAQDLATLGVSAGHSEAELKRAYKEAMRKAHPDLGGSDADAAKVVDAYTRLAGVFKAGVPSEVPVGKDRKDTGLRAQLLNSIERGEAENLLRDDAWGLQEKMDGKHVIVRCAKGKVSVANKQGLETQIPPDIELGMAQSFDGFTFDGELIGGMFFVFDLLEVNNNSVRDLTYRQRHKILLGLGFPACVRVVRLMTGAEKAAEFDRLLKSGAEGAVFKRLDARWSEGRPHSGGDMLKHKFVATLSAIVSDEQTGKNSFHSFVWDGDKKLPLGRCTVPGGRPVPRPGTVVEIRYLYCVENLVQPCFLGIRDDVAPEECTAKQIQWKGKSR